MAAHGVVQKQQGESLRRETNGGGRRWARAVSGDVFLTVQTAASGGSVFFLKPLLCIRIFLFLFV